ncbi:sensor histidine kinase [Plantactinospora sp. GCM10030261]|uniref:sensor histidine kinase n=1 Tax=Plantactinospora sp. GCM10030261 TaxID=3273420 RepID=UPI00361AEFD0
MSAGHIPRFPFARPLDRRGLIVVDTVVALVLAQVCAEAAHVGAGVVAGIPVAGHWAFPVVAGLLLAGPLAVRRLWPLGVLITVFLLGEAALLTGVVPDFAGAAPYTVISYALYLVAVVLPGRRSLTILLCCLGAASAVALVMPDAGGEAAGGWLAVAFAVLMFGSAWVLGGAVRERRAHAATSATQAARQAVVDERLRIARELHDIVAHSMSVIAVKAAVADHVADARPDEVRTALRDIAATSRDTLAELRRTVGALRSDETRLAPVPGLADLPALVRATPGGPVTLDLDPGVVTDVPPGVGLSAYRIVQEALTNVVRHADGAACRVVVAVADGAVRVEVADDGPGAPDGPRPGGQGLVGMRERVLLYGGELIAGTGPGGGFRVSARLPFDSVASLSPVGGAAS